MYVEVCIFDYSRYIHILHILLNKSNNRAYIDKSVCSSACLSVCPSVRPYEHLYLIDYMSWRYQIC